MALKHLILLDESSKYLNNIGTVPYDVIITGDLNFHVDIKSDVETRRFCSILDSHRLIQHVNSTTHKGGHTLDLVISR